MSRFADHPLVQFPAFRSFYLGNVLVSAAARSVTIILCWWLISSGEKGASQLSILMLMQSIPILAFSVLYGPLIDRFDRRRCMLFGAAAQLVMSVVLFYAFHTGGYSFSAICAIVFVLSIFCPLVDDASSAAVEQLVDEKQLTAAAAVQSTVFELSNILAATTATTVMGAYGVPQALGLTVVLYVIGVVFLAQMGTGTSKEKSDGPANYLGELKAGFQYITGTRALFTFVCIYFTVVFFLQQTFILIPLIVGKLLNATVKWVGILETSFSIGVVTTAFLVSTKTSHRHVYRTYSIAIAGAGLCLLGASVIRSPYLTALTLMTLGVFFAQIWSFSSMLYQKVVPEEIKGRFFSVISTAGAGITPLSYMAVGQISDLLGPRATMTIDGVGLLILAAVAIRLPRLVEHLDEEPAPSDTSPVQS